LLVVLAEQEFAMSGMPDFVLIADQVRDPGNLGTLLRTAAAAGVQAVLLAPGTTDAFAPKVLRAGMGAHFLLPLSSLDWSGIRQICKPRMKIYLAEAGAGFPKGDYGGENALDTKRLAKHERGKIRVLNCRAWGFKNERPGDWAAFNIKEKVYVEVVECEVRDSQIAFRLPTYRKGDQMQCEIKDCVIRDCATAFRIEDQAIGKEGKPGGTKIVGCRIENCKTGVDFVGVRAEGPLGRIGFKPESSMTDCVFVPELTVNIARATNKDYRALLAHLLEQGNREETTDAEPHESAEAAEGSSDDEAPRHTPRGKE
jgi:hypothetical protein